MTDNHLLLYRLTELMLKHEQHLLPVDMLFDDGQIGDFVKSIQIDSPYQQMLIEGVLTESVREEKLYVAFTVEGYFHYVLGEVITEQTEGKDASELKKLVNENKLKGAKEGVEQCLIRGITKGNFHQLTQIIDEEDKFNEICIIPLYGLLKMIGPNQMISKLMEYPSKNDWNILLKLLIKISSLDQWELYQSLLSETLQKNPINSESSIEIAVRCLKFLNQKERKTVLRKITSCQTVIQKNWEIPLELAEIHYFFADYKNAIKFLKLSLEIRVKKNTKKSVDHVIIYKLFGSVYWKLEEYIKAIEFNEKALLIQINEVGKEDYNAALIYNNIGTVYESNKNFESAIQFYNKSLEITKKVVGSNHSHIATCYYNLSGVFGYLGDIEKLLKNAQSALNIYIKTHGINSVEASNTYNNIGYGWAVLGDNDKAIEFFIKALESKKTIFGNSHPELISEYINIGTIFYRKENYSSAIINFNQVNEILSKSGKIKQTELSDSYFNLGKCFFQMFEFLKAADCFQQSINIRISGRAYYNLAQSFEKLLQPNFALDKYIQAAEEYNRNKENISDNDLFKNSILNAKIIANQLNQNSKLPIWFDKMLD